MLSLSFMLPGTEKTMLMYTKHTSLHYFNYLTFCVSYTSSVWIPTIRIAGCTIIAINSFTDTLHVLKRKLLKLKV